MELRVTSVHEALSSAAEKSADERKSNDYITQTFKINKSVKELAEGICAQHGTNLSEFYRACTEVLVSDYAGKPAEDVEAQDAQA